MRDVHPERHSRASGNPLLPMLSIIIVDGDYPPRKSRVRYGDYETREPRERDVHPERHSRASGNPLLPMLSIIIVDGDYPPRKSRARYGDYETREPRERDFPLTPLSAESHSNFTLSEGCFEMGDDESGGI
jgi:hypothetical protein